MLSKRFAIYLMILVLPALSLNMGWNYMASKSRPKDEPKASSTLISDEAPHPDPASVQPESSPAPQNKELQSDLFEIVRDFSSLEPAVFQSKIDQALEKHGEEEHLLSLAGDYFYQSEDYQKAFDYTLRLSKIEPENRSTALRLAELHAILGRAELALTQTENLVDQNPRDAEALGQFLALSFQAEQVKRAEAKVKSFLKDEPGNAAAIETLWKTPGVSSADKNNYLDAAYQANPLEPKLQHLKALQSFFDQDYERSRSFSKGLLNQEIAPDQRARSEDLIIQSWIVEERYDEALARIRELQAKHPDYVFLQEREADIRLRQAQKNSKAKP